MPRAQPSQPPASVTSAGPGLLIPGVLAKRFPWLANPYLWFALFYGWMALVWVLSSKAGPDLPHGPKIPHLDKLAHTVEYSAGAFVLMLAHVFSRPGARGWRAASYVLPCVTLYGMLDEVHQAYIPGRSGADAGDIAADFFGATLACAAIIIWHRRSAASKPAHTARDSHGSTH